jgi:hypothetical protein
LNASDTDGDLETSCDGDCDDTDINVNTSALEVCDATDTDEDCDGFINEADTAAVGNNVGVDESSYLTYYADVDLDGYGDDAEMSSGCTAPDGYIDVGGDCLDEDSVNGFATNPGASEICDGINNNCDVDGLIDEDATDMVVWFVDADLDGEGVSYAEGVDPVMACADAQPDATVDNACRFEYRL